MTAAVIFVKYQMHASHKHDYTNKQEKKRFITWYLDNYGYNTHRHDYNSRLLSERYQRETNILIPKLTIYRWLTKLYNPDTKTIGTKHKESNSQVTDTVLHEYVSHYVCEQFTHIPDNVVVSG